MPSELRTRGPAPNPCPWCRKAVRAAAMVSEQHRDFPFVFFGKLDSPDGTLWHLQCVVQAEMKFRCKVCLSFHHSPEGSCLL